MKVKKQILESIKYALDEKKYTLVSEYWGSTITKCACALGCVLLKNGDNESVLDVSLEESTAKAAQYLKVKEDWVDAFAEGFDGVGNSEASKDADAWKIGNEVRKETNPVSFYSHNWK